MRIVAFDLSLRATGWAEYNTASKAVTTAMLERFNLHEVAFGTLDVKKRVGIERLHWIRSSIAKKSKFADFVIIEDLAFAARDTNHERAGLAYLVRHRLWQLGVPYVLVAPTTLKKFVTGKGNGEKSLMLKAVFQNWKVDAKNDNEADAVGLLYIGLGLAGVRRPSNAAQTAVLKTVQGRMTPALLESLAK